MSEQGPAEPIWFEGRIQALDFHIDGEEVVLWVASNISGRHSMEVRLRELSDTDQLTGLFNRRRLEQDLAMHFEAFTRYRVPTAVVMLDLDGLKGVNDTAGHHAGDEVIRAVGDICRRLVRKGDTLCRFGGDEFVLLLPNTGREQAVSIAARLQVCLREGLAHGEGESARVTASLGVAAMTAGDDSGQDALRRADQALYEAKGRGKDQVVVA